MTTKTKTKTMQTETLEERLARLEAERQALAAEKAKQDAKRGREEQARKVRAAQHFMAEAPRAISKAKETAKGHRARKLKAAQNQDLAEWLAADVDAHAAAHAENRVLYRYHKHRDFLLRNGIAPDSDPFANRFEAKAWAGDFDAAKSMNEYARAVASGTVPERSAEIYAEVCVPILTVPEDADQGDDS